MRSTISSCSHSAPRQTRVILSFIRSTKLSKPASGRVIPHAAKDTVLSFLAQGESLYSKNPDFSAAIEELLVEATTPPDARAALEAGTGTWKVFWAPHISTMSATLLGTQFEPILYHFHPDGSLSSNVKYTSPLIGSGWLSAAGSMNVQDGSSVSINFNEFWVDFGDNLRSTPGAHSNETQTNSTLDSLVSQVGRAAFLPSFAVFPVLYMDSDIAVFKFPPLNSKIAIARQTTTALTVV